MRTTVCGSAAASRACARNSSASSPGPAVPAGVSTAISPTAPGAASIAMNRVWPWPNWKFIGPCACAHAAGLPGVVEVVVADDAEVRDRQVGCHPQVVRVALGGPGAGAVAEVGEEQRRGAQPRGLLQQLGEDRVSRRVGPGAAVAGDHERERILHRRRADALRHHEVALTVGAHRVIAAIRPSRRVTEIGCRPARARARDPRRPR